MHSRPQSHSAERTTGSRDENRKYRVLFVRVQWMQRNIPKRVMYVQTKLSGSAHYLRLRFLGQIQKKDHESMKSTSYVDSSDQIQMRICEFHSLFVFWERIWTKNF